MTSIFDFMPQIEDEGITEAVAQLKVKHNERAPKWATFNESISVRNQLYFDYCHENDLYQDSKSVGIADETEILNIAQRRAWATWQAQVNVVAQLKSELKEMK